MISLETISPDDLQIMVGIDDFVLLTLGSLDGRVQVLLPTDVVKALARKVLDALEVEA